MKERKEKKEFWVWIGILVFVGVAILLIPMFDDYLSGRHHDREQEKIKDNLNKEPEKNDDKKEEIGYTSLVCTIPASDLDHKITEYEFKVTFEKNGSLKTSEVTRTIHYENQTAYQDDKTKSATLPMSGTGFQQTKTFDDKNVVSSLHVTYDHTLFNTSQNESDLALPSTSLKNRTEIEAYIKDLTFSCSKS